MQQTIRMADFAKAMVQHAGDSFPDRVRQFESRFGKADDDALAVLAQAAYYCWGNCRYRDNLLQVCTAINTGRPTYMYLHNQVGPARWIELNAYVVGVQCWLNPEAARAPDVVAKDTIASIGGWLGERSGTKEVLASLFLGELVGSLAGMNLNRLGAPGPADGDEYHNFSAWYTRPDGTYYTRGRRQFADRCAQQLAPEMASGRNGVAEIVDNLVRGRPHACLHRFGRHLDIQLTSIGVLAWRGNLPPNNVPKEAWVRFIDEDCGLSAWLDGAAPANDYAARVHTALGRADARKRAIVADFLCAPDRGSVYSGDWIREQSRAMGRRAYQVLGIDYE